LDLGGLALVQGASYETLLLTAVALVLAGRVARQGRVMLRAARAHLRAGTLALVDGGCERWSGKPVAQGEPGCFTEARVSPGDEVEVVGRLGKEVDVHAPSSGHRLPPTRYTLTAPEHGPLLVLASRRLA
jgi:hypothetical protein